MAEYNQRFDSFEQWVSKASSWLTRHDKYNEKYWKAIAFDNAGNIVMNGADMHRARDENLFPVHWVWPDQNIFEAIDAILKEKP